MQKQEAQAHSWHCARAWHSRMVQQCTAHQSCSVLDTASQWCSGPARCEPARQKTLGWSWLVQYRCIRGFFGQQLDGNQMAMAMKPARACRQTALAKANKTAAASCACSRHRQQSTNNYSCTAAVIQEPGTAACFHSIAHQACSVPDTAS